MTAKAPGGWTRRHLLAALGVAGLAGCGGGSGPSAAFTEEVGVRLSDDTRVVTPPGFDQRYRWPAVVFLPSTGRTAPNMYRTYAGLHQARGNFVAVLPPGTTDADGYSDGEAFADTVRRWSSQVGTSIAEAVGSFSVAPSRVVVAGFSLGGDLAWALPLVAPRRYAGSIVMGSRCGWRQPESLGRLHAERFRAALLYGREEASARAGGMAAAGNLLADSGIAYRLASYDGGHTRAPPALLFEMLDFVLGGTERIS